MRSFTLSRRQAIALGAAGFASIAIRPRPARAAEVTWRVANDLPLTHPLNVRLHEMADSLNTATSGRMQLQVFPSSQLGGDTEMLSQLRSNAVQAFWIPGGILATLVPNTSITYVGYAFKDYKQVWAAMDGDLGAFCRASIEKTGLAVMPAIWNNGFNDVFSSSHPIRTPDDYRDFKIRTSVSPIFVSTFKALGASPTAVNLNEAYSALQTKLVNGVTDPLVILESEKFYEVLKYASLTRQMWGGYWPLVNHDAWSALPKKLQDTYIQLSSEAAGKQRADIAKMEQEMPPKLTRWGLAINTPEREPFIKKLREAGFYSQWRKTFGENGWRALEKYAGPVG